MDSLTAVYLAGNILQFLGFISNLISPTRRTHSHGLKQGYLDLGDVSKTIQKSTKEIIRMVPESNSYDEDDHGLPAIASRCTAIANELIRVLKSGKQIVRQNFYLALLSTEWNERDVRLLLKKLDWIDRQVNSYFSPSKIGETDRRIKHLAMENQRSDSNRADKIEELKRQLTSGFIAIKNERYDYRREQKVYRSFISAGKIGMRLSAEQLVLEKLRYETMDDRYNSIKHAHEKTASWIFGDTEASSETIPSLSEWMASSDNLYWISGNPGSGKSTIMKYLCTHQKTGEQLEKWASGSELVVASFFFWNAAKDDLQKNQQGFLRSVIYQVLRKCPDIIPEVYKEHWSLNKHPPLFPRSTKISTSIETLLEKLELMLNALKSAKPKLRLAFFIDGLDEYDGKPEEVIELVKTLLSWPNIKICASSRPWNEFENFFGQRRPRKVYVHDFNGEDMRIFIEDSLHEGLDHQEFTENLVLERLTQEMIDAAQGMFLWVYLVVCSFKERLANGERIADLQARLKEFPTDLDDAFEGILFGEENTYPEQASKMMLITLEARKDLPLLLCWFIDQEEGWDEESVLLDEASMKRHIDQMDKQLNAYCKGLIEAQERPEHTVSIARSPTHHFHSPRVVFLHRSVRDYLQTPRAKHLLSSRSSADFSTEKSICQGLLRMVRSMSVETNNDKLDTLTKLLGIFFDHVAALEEGSQFWRMLIEGLDTAVASFDYTPHNIGSVYTSSPQTMQVTAQQALKGHIDSFFALSWANGLKRSVAQFLSQSHDHKYITTAFNKAMWTFDPAFVHFVLAEGNIDHATGIRLALATYLKAFCQDAQIPRDENTEAERCIYHTVMGLLNNDTHYGTRRSSVLGDENPGIQVLRLAFSRILTTEHCDDIMKVFKEVSHLALGGVDGPSLPLLDEGVVSGKGETEKALEVREAGTIRVAGRGVNIRNSNGQRQGKVTVVLRKALLCWRG